MSLFHKIFKKEKKRSAQRAVKDQKAVKDEQEKPSGKKEKEASRALQQESGQETEKQAVQHPETKTEEERISKKIHPCLQDIILRPVVTEKSASLSDQHKYVFEVQKSANKIDVKKAIKEIYGVEPIRVNIKNISGKRVQFRRILGRTKERKIAIITVKEGQNIEIYKGV